MSVQENLFGAIEEIALAGQTSAPGVAVPLIGSAQRLLALASGALDESLGDAPPPPDADPSAPGEFRTIFEKKGLVHAPKAGDGKDAKWKVKLGSSMEPGTTAVRISFSYTAPAGGTDDPQASHTLAWLHNNANGGKWWGNAFLYGVWKPAAGKVKLAHNAGLAKPRDRRPELGEAGAFELVQGTKYHIVMEYFAGGFANLYANGRLVSTSKAAQMAPFGDGAWMLVLGNPEGNEKHLASPGAIWENVLGEAKRVDA